MSLWIAVQCSELSISPALVRLLEPKCSFWCGDGLLSGLKWCSLERCDMCINNNLLYGVMKDFPRPYMLHEGHSREVLMALWLSSKWKLHPILERSQSVSSVLFCSCWWKAIHTWYDQEPLHVWEEHPSPPANHQSFTSFHTKLGYCFWILFWIRLHNLNVCVCACVCVCMHMPVCSCKDFSDREQDIISTVKNCYL